MRKKDVSKIAGETTRRGEGGIVPPEYTIEKPNITEKDHKKFFALMEEDFSKSRNFYERANTPRYLYWDKYKYKIGSDREYSPEQIWNFVRRMRSLSSVETPIKTEGGKLFQWLRLTTTDEFLHKIDMFAGGRLFNRSEVLTTENRTFLSRGLIEEAIASSQLEGAHTTRKAAREMIIQKRKPQNESEQMILNNHKTMSTIVGEYKDQELNLELLFEMHGMLTENTIDPSEQNRLRLNQDNIVIQGDIGQETFITHIPPGEKFIAKEIKHLIDYANDVGSTGFTHPITKAIFIHFWVGYLHPFTDGNGRLARALFYWYLLKKDYWTFTYLPVSTILKNTPMQYAMAYIYSEQDSFDITYFYDFHIKKILQAIKEFEEYLDGKIDENKTIEKKISQRYELNDRQKQLIYYLISDKDPSVSVSSHMLLHNVSRVTASTDLKSLESKELIKPKRSGKFIKYFPTEKLLQCI